MKNILSIILFLLFGQIYCQVVVIYKIDLPEDFSGSLHMEYIEDSSLTFGNIMWPTKQEIISQESSSFMFSVNANNKSILRIPVDTDGGYIDLLNIQKFKNDTVYISQYDVVENKFESIKVTTEVIFKHSKQGSKYLKTNYHKNIKKIGTETDSICSFEIGINNKIYNLKLNATNVSNDLMHYDGREPIWKIYLFNLLFKKEPNRYKSFGTTISENKTIWKGKLIL